MAQHLTPFMSSRSGNAKTTIIHHDLINVTDVCDRWPWISYPTTVLLLVCTFVAITIHQNRTIKPWKTSILPALFHSIRDIDQAELADLTRPVAMRKKAEALFAELKELEDIEEKTKRTQWHVTL